MLVCLCALPSLAWMRFFRICIMIILFLRLLLGLRRCGKFCRGFFVFWLLILIGGGLLRRGRRHGLIMKCFLILLLLGLIRLRFFGDGVVLFFC